jgi:hypothetical protein
MAKRGTRRPGELHQRLLVVEGELDDAVMEVRRLRGLLKNMFMVFIKNDPGFVDHGAVEEAIKHSEKYDPPQDPAWQRYGRVFVYREPEEVDTVDENGNIAKKTARDPW